MEAWRDYEPVNYDIHEQVRTAASRQIKGIPEHITRTEIIPELELSTLDEFEERAPEWLVPVYIPKRQITLICGTGGTGKTTLWASLAASISTGSRTVFDGSEKEEENSFIIKRDPHSVLFFSGEDSIEYSLKKKLRENNADMKMIKAISMNETRFKQIKFEGDYLKRLIEYNRPALCIFDPLQSFLDKKVKMSERNAMRQSLENLLTYGENYGTTFIIVMHTNKQLNAWGRNRMADSADLWDLARSVLMLGDTEDPNIKYLSHEKSSYGAPGKTLLLKNVEGCLHFWNWSEKKDRDYILEETKQRNDRRTKDQKDEIVNYIMSALAESPEGVLASDLNEQLKDLGYADYAVKEVKSGLNKANRIKYDRSGYQGKLTIKKP